MNLAELLAAAVGGGGPAPAGSYAAQGSNSNWLMPDRLAPQKPARAAAAAAGGQAAAGGGGGKAGGGKGSSGRGKVPLPPEDPRYATDAYLDETLHPKGGIQPTPYMYDTSGSLNIPATGNTIPSTLTEAATGLTIPSIPTEAATGDVVGSPLYAPYGGRPEGPVSDNGPEARAYIDETLHPIGGVQPAAAMYNVPLPPVSTPPVMPPPGAGSLGPFSRAPYLNPSLPAPSRAPGPMSAIIPGPDFGPVSRRLRNTRVG